MLDRSKLPLAKPFVLAAYRFRRWRRNSRRFPVRWHTQASLIADDLEIIREVDGADAVGSAFLDRMVASRDAAATAARTFATISFAVTAYFVLTFLSIELPISVFGFELKRVPGINEVLLLFSAGLNVFSAIGSYRVAALDAIIRASINKNYPGSLLYFYSVALLPRDFAVIFRPSYQPHLAWHGGKQLVQVIIVTIALLLLFGLLAGILVFRAFIYWWVWSEPSTTNDLLQFSVILSIFLDAGVLLFVLSYMLPLPHRDYSRLHEYTIAEQHDPERAAELREHLWREEIEDEQEMIRKGYLKER